MTNQLDDAVVRLITRALKDFGYNVDFAYCRKTVDDLMAGEPPVGGPAAFIQDWLQKANLLPRDDKSEEVSE